MRRIAQAAVRAISPGARRRLRKALAATDAEETLRWELPVVGDRLGEVTERLFDRLPPGTVDEVRRRLSEDEARFWASMDATQQKRLAIAFATQMALPGVEEATGLRPFQPPTQVFAMARGPIEERGSYELADMVVDGLARVGAAPAAGEAGLDFGCASGRIVRLMGAAYPDLRWHGREPNTAAVSWAAEQLPEIDLRASAADPPLDLASDSLDFAFAISIWSHFSEPAARRWLDEMRRVIRQGGYLLLSVHGHHSVAFFHASGLRQPGPLAEAKAGLARRGYWLTDYSDVNRDWGTSFTSLEWLCSAATPEWRLGWFACARAGGNQDLIVLQRVR